MTIFSKDANKLASCPNDTDGDGDCHLCWRNGGCPNKSMSEITNTSQHLQGSKQSWFESFEKTFEPIVEFRRQLGRQMVEALYLIGLVLIKM